MTMASNDVMGNPCVLGGSFGQPRGHGLGEAKMLAPHDRKIENEDFFERTCETAHYQKNLYQRRWSTMLRCEWLTGGARAYRSTLIAERRTMLFRHVAEGF